MARRRALALLFAACLPQQPHGAALKVAVEGDPISCATCAAGSLDEAELVLSLEPAASTYGPSRWDVIGPFPTSYWESGEDVLEAFGGIRRIPRGGNLKYPSELQSSWNDKETSRVGWHSVTPNGARMTVDYGDMRWSFMQGEYGGAIAYGRNWAVGDFEVPQTGTYAINVNSGTDFYWVDDQKLAGDRYSRGWAGTQPVMLEAGTHTFYVPFLTYGSSKSFDCTVNAYSDASQLQAIVRPGEGARPMLFSYIVDGVIASNIGSVVVENRGDKMMTITGVAVGSDQAGDFALTLSAKSPTSMIPGQQLPLRFDVQQIPDSVSCSDDDQGNSHYDLRVTVTGNDGDSDTHTVDVDLVIQCRSFAEPYIFTFADADESVQYAAVRSPSGTCPPQGCPVLFATHGAGVESDPRRNGAWAGSYRRRETSWLLLPTNKDQYGYGWQSSGFENGLRALQHLVAELPGVSTSMRAVKGADRDRLLYSGHSMGGHGCLEFLTKQGDRALAAVPASGWIRTDLYPYTIRIGDNLADNHLRGIMRASLAEWDTESHAGNAVGIPVMMRLGADDTSVPPYQLRRFARLLDQESGTAHATQISEIPDEGHWFGGIVDDDVLGAFYDQAFEDSINNTNGLPSLPQRFSNTVLNPATSDGRGGIRVEQLRIPYRAGRVHVDRGAETGDTSWQVWTENVRRLSFYELPGRPLPDSITVDGEEFPGPLPVAPAHLCNLDDTNWRRCEGEEATSWLSTERSASNYGPLRQVFHSGQLFLVYGTGGGAAYAAAMERQARYIVQHTYYRGRFAITVVADTDARASALVNDAAYKDTNVIVLGGPDVNTFAAATAASSPIPWSTGGCSDAYSIGGRCYNVEGLGFLFMAPHWGAQGTGGKPRLNLVVAGNTQSGFELAADLVPMIYGHALPDYVVVEPTWKWKGFGGVVAAGYYSNQWELAAVSGYWGFRPFRSPPIPATEAPTPVPTPAPPTPAPPPVPTPAPPPTGGFFGPLLGIGAVVVLLGGGYVASTSGAFGNNAGAGEEQELAGPVADQN